MTQPATSLEISWSVKDSYRYCERLARTHYENFTVGSLLMPKSLRRHLYALYAYCRTVDDLGDEAIPGGKDPHFVPAQVAAGGLVHDTGTYRLALLDWWESELGACYEGEPSHPVHVALQETIHKFSLPREPLLKLIEANRMEQQAQRYPTYADLLHYCDHSANPVGRLVLHLFGYSDEERQRMSDATCTALQLTNFWQDVARDYQKGRIYIPLEDMARFEYGENELAEGVESRAFQELMAFEVEGAAELFREGAPLAGTLAGPARLDVALFTRGGMAVLEAIRRQGYRVLRKRPALSRARKAGLFLSAWAGAKLGTGWGLPESQTEEVEK